MKNMKRSTKTPLLLQNTSENLIAGHSRGCCPSGLDVICKKETQLAATVVVWVAACMQYVLISTFIFLLFSEHNVSKQAVQRVTP